MAPEEPLEATSSNHNRYDKLSSEELALEMEKTRMSLAGKLNRLEEEVGDKVRNTVDHVSGQIVGTVDHIADTVKHSVAQVQSQFDLPARIEKNPYKTLGGVMVAGLAFGAWIAQKKKPHRGSSISSAKAFQTGAGSGVLPLVKGLVATMLVTAARQLLETKVHGYINSLQSKGLQSKDRL